MAESKCNNLKDQLDHMKEVYGLKKQQGRSRKISTISTIKKTSEDEVTTSSRSATSADGKFLIKKQNSNAIGTDNSGAAVRTINNILNGITDSVNRLSELHVQTAESPGRKNPGRTSTPLPVLEINIPPTAETQGNSQIEIQQSTKLTISNKSRAIKKRGKDMKTPCKKTNSFQSVRRTVRTCEKKSRMTSTRTSVLERTIPRFRDKKSVSYGPRSKSTHLVEIYHNLAAKNSDSDEGQLNKTKKATTRCEETQVDINIQNEVDKVPPLIIPNRVNPHAETNIDEPNGLRCDRTTRIGDAYNPPEAPRTVSCYSKNYELPTIASRMKQAAKYYLNTFNFKAIPFCAAISTSPSHNIGINIQQVMNIIKNRQPVNGISPTLAHNIGLAADRLNSKPLSTLMSTITSKTCYKPSRCPLSKSFLNYEHLQDIARGIPEETPEDLEDEADSPEIQTVIITGPSGDMEVRTKKPTTWTMESDSSEQCTCIPTTGADFQQIINKYKNSGTGANLNTILTQKNKWQKYPNVKEKKKIESKNTNGVISSPNVYQPAEEQPLQGKEKNLKDVLMNLHNEFENLNKKYEDLCQKTTSDDDETLKELELLENELNKKEEEITMVMTLYKEVLALKQQIKCLKQRASQGSVAINEVKETTSNFSNYSNPKAALHLTKLLKQIQMYQMRYKRGNAV